MIARIFVIDQEKNRMRSLLIIILTCTLLTSCSWFRIQKMTIEQGNVITQDQVQQLHLGMTRDEVVAVMGNPVLYNTFDDNRMDYVYTLKPPYEKRTEKRVIIFLREPFDIPVSSTKRTLRGKHHFAV